MIDLNKSDSESDRESASDQDGEDFVIEFRRSGVSYRRRR
jgi:hypothetical protein